MKNRILLGSALAFALSLSAGMAVNRPASAPGNYDIVIYGGGPQAVSTALQASATTEGRASILMIVPERAPGSIMSVGRQNLFDVNYYRASKLPEGIDPKYEGSQAGSLYRFLGDLTAVFPPEKMEAYFRTKLAEKRVQVRYDTDLVKVTTRPAAAGAGENAAAGSHRVSSVELKPLVRNADGHAVFDETAPGEPVSAQVFVDASETGRLVRLSGQHVGTVGREDQNPDARQMAATLMFKVRGVDAQKAVKDWSLEGFTMSPKGSFQLWGGYEMRQLNALQQYAESAGPFRLKPYNAGEDGYSGAGAPGSPRMELWMNMLLIYDVDARKAARDRGAGEALYPSGGGTEPELAREEAVREIAKPEFLSLLRQLKGFEQAELVLVDGKPEVGEILYLRESIHTAQVADPATRTYRFALDREGVTGGDTKYYERRIGLGYYHFDSNSYKKGESLSNPIGKPWYVPYDVLVGPKLSNVLLPGYAANIDSYAWTAMRVYPNLIMLGDAAGTAAGLAVKGEFSLHRPEPEQLHRLQQTLFRQGAILDK
ncbi:hypothetical protein J31TS4_47100 [Paenibacillus sp. J31TS4]|uniref:FAD-dependent oxidoreductase n=1 Tax=Paenibacillus sp. J31TS4 TaxID=2807195 RepID=UPI001B16690C|nr:FAD-dependent oxidoreductase [Paenibacillus sp. J31TS4]GIP41430.1 hypothetical protein J31TS4_47100 [Paenibacillus sp. J31TS4]